MPFRWCVVLVALAACTGPHAQTTPDATAHLGLGDRCSSTPATGAELVAMLSPLYSASLLRDGTASQLTMGLTYTGGAITCSGHTLRVEMNETFRTADGALDEQIDGEILSQDATSVGFVARVPAAQLHGSYLSAIDAPADVTLSFTGELAGGRIVDGVVRQASPAASSGVGVIQ